MARLHHTLSLGDHKEAGKLLREMAGGGSLLHNFLLWRMAKAGKRHDILWAMLILRSDALRELGLLPDGTNDADRGKTSRRPGKLSSSSTGPNVGASYKQDTVMPVKRFATPV